LVTGAVERDASLAEADVRGSADHEVVEHRNVEKSPGRDCFGCQVQVVGARGGVARRVVVDEDDAACVAPNRLTEQLADADERTRNVADVQPVLGDDPALDVEQENMELFMLESAELEQQPVSDVGGMADVPTGADRRELEATAAVRARCGRDRTVSDDSGEPRRGVAGSLVDPAVPRR
jgi:hypothetical protein